MRTPLLAAMALLGTLFISTAAHAVAVYDFQSIPALTDQYTSKQRIVDTRSGVEHASEIVGGDISLQHYAGFGVLGGNEHGAAPGATELLTFAAPPRFLGLVISGLFSQPRNPISNDLPAPVFAQLTAYDNEGAIVLDTIIRATTNGMAFIDFEGLVENIHLLTLSTGGGLNGLGGPGASTAAFVVQVSEPGVLVLFGLGLALVGSTRRYLR